MNQKKERKPHNFKWDYEACKLEALKYNTKTEFINNNKGAYLAAYRNGWIESICIHMIQKQKHRGYWNRKNCEEIALTCKNRAELSIKYGTVYNVALKNNWLDDICSHMVEIRKPNGYWTFQHCKEEALKYNSRIEFIKKNGTVYNIVRKNNWLDDICNHMKPLGNKFKRLIYVFEFSDKSVYIGLTYNFEKRKNEHLKKKSSPVYKHIKVTKLPATFKIISDYLSIQESQKLEKETIEKYKKNNWNVLNKAKPGGLGGNTLKWTYEECLKISNTFKTKSEFKIKQSGAYSAARKNGWLTNICKHMKEIRKYNGYWSKDIILQEALKYKTKTEFRKKCGTAYKIALKNNWINDICKHMIEGKKPNGYWNNKLNCKLAASECSIRSEFEKKYHQGWFISKQNGWLDEFFPKKKAS